MKNNNRSQIATIIIFIIAVIFVFVLVTMNISRLAQKKTAVSNVADSVGLQAASQLGSMSSGLRQKFAIYGDATENCDWNWKLTLGPIILALAILVAVLTIPFHGGTAFFPLGAAATKVAVGIALSLGIFGASLTGVGAVAQFFATNPGAIEQLSIKMRNLSGLQQTVELPIQAALFAMVDDPTWVPDEYDMDRDGQTGAYDANGNIVGDRIPRIFKWYNLRLNAFPRIGQLVQDFYKDFFANRIENNPQTGRFFILEDENLIVKVDPITQRPYIDWQIDSDGDGIRDLKVAPWLRDELPKMLKEMRTYGYGIDATLDSNSNIATIGESGLPIEDIVANRWPEEIEKFEGEMVRGLHDIDFDSAVQGIDAWLPLLRNDKNENGLADDADCYTDLGDLSRVVTALKDKLVQRRGQIHSCIQPCAQYSWSCCGSPTCSWSCCGTYINCGGLCNDDHCRPGNYCATPTGGSLGCCDVRPLESYSECSSNYTNIVDRYNAITILEQFASDIESVRGAIDRLSKELKNDYIETYDKMHEAFYVWSDKVNAGTPNEQVAGHIVYVRVEGLNPREKSEGGDGFKLPAPKDTTKWDPLPYTCITVENAEGEFMLTVARYDEDVSKTGPLSRFWRFRFSRPGMNEAMDGFVRRIAEIVNINIKTPAANYFYEITDEGKNGLRDILRKYGIVSKIKVHYGPGYTYTPEEIKNLDSIPGSAAKRNRDIWIKWRSSNFDQQ